MSNKNLSKYINNPIADKKSILLSNVFDYFITLIATLFIFYIGLLISNNIPATKQAISNYNDVVSEVKSFINTTHLTRYNLETGEQLSVEVDASSYLTTIVKTSAYIYDLNYPIRNEDSTYDINHKVSEQETFLFEKENYKFDNISYFYYKFAEANPELKDFTYNNEDYKDNIETFIYLKTMGYESINNYESIFVSEDNTAFTPFKGVLSRFLVLNEELTSSLINRLVYNDSSDIEAGKVASNIKIGYVNGIQHAIDIVQNKSVTYKNIELKFNKAYEGYALIGLATFIISYLFAYLSMFGLGRAMAGSFLTISQKTRFLGLARVDESSPSFLNMFIYHLCNFVLHLSSSIIVFMFTGYTGIYNITLFGSINIFVIELILIFLVITSIAFTLISKNGQSLPLIVSRMVLKDTKVYESIDLNKQIEEKNGDNI